MPFIVKSITYKGITLLSLKPKVDQEAKILNKEAGGNAAALADSKRHNTRGTKLLQISLITAFILCQEGEINHRPSPLLDSDHPFLPGSKITMLEGFITF